MQDSASVQTLSLEQSLRSWDQCQVEEEKHGGGQNGSNGNWHNGGGVAAEIVRYDEPIRDSVVAVSNILYFPSPIWGRFP